MSVVKFPLIIILLLSVTWLPPSTKRLAIRESESFNSGPFEIGLLTSYIRLYEPVVLGAFVILAELLLVIVPEFAIDKAVVFASVPLNKFKLVIVIDELVVKVLLPRFRVKVLRLLPTRETELGKLPEPPIIKEELLLPDILPPGLEGP